MFFKLYSLQCMIMLLFYETITFKSISLLISHMLDKFTVKLFRNLLNGKGRAIWKDPAEHCITAAAKTRWSLIYFSPLSKAGPSAITIQHNSEKCLVL